MSIYRLEYCPTCKRTVTSNKGICKRCGGKVIFRGYGVRVAMINEEGREIHRALSPFSTQKEARQAEAEFRATHPLNARKNIKPYDITLNDLYYNYYQYTKSRVKPSTLYEIESVYKNVIKPHFGNFKLTSIEKRNIIKWQSLLDKQNYKYATKSKFRNRFHAILKYGVLYFDLPTNAIEHVPPFKNTDNVKKMSIWTPDEFGKFINNVDNIEYKAFFSLLYYTGCRKGEAQALHWSDIEFKNNTISITKNISRKADHTGFIVTTPKNSSSIRNIVMPDPLIRILQEYYKISTQNKFVFGNNKPLPETSISRKFKETACKSDLTEIRIHDLRHSHASYLISQGVDIVSVAKRLGHKDIEQTLNTYSHVLDNKESAAIEALNRLRF